MWKWTNQQSQEAQPQEAQPQEAQPQEAQPQEKAQPPTRLDILNKQAEAWDELLRSARLTIQIATPFLALGAFLGGFGLTTPKPELPASLQRVCEDTEEFWYNHKTPLEAADAQLRQTHPELNGQTAIELTEELIDQRELYYQLIKLCREVE